MQEARSIDTLWNLDEQEIRFVKHDRKISEVMRGDPADTLLYAVLCSIYEGYSTKPALYDHLESMFVVRLGRMTVSPVDVDEVLQHGFNEKLILRSQDGLSLSELGISILKQSRKQVPNIPVRFVCLY